MNALSLPDITTSKTTIIKPYGIDADGWRITHIEATERMEIWEVATLGSSVEVRRRLLGSRQVTDLTHRMTGVYGTSHASRVREVVALAERRPSTRKVAA